jgi:hypothetical protein
MFNEVSKAEFKALYTIHARPDDGWTAAYWDTFYEGESRPALRFLYEPPESPAHTRMMLVEDHGQGECRMFFLTEEALEGFFS